MRILIIGADAGGNVPPARAAATELSRRGHEVLLAGLRSRDGDAGPGRSVPFPAMDGFSLTGRLESARFMASMVRFCASPAAARDVTAMIAEQRPDVAVVDGMMFSGIDAANRSGVPTVALLHTFAGYLLPAFTRPPNSLVLAVRRLDARRVWASAVARIVVSDRELDPLPGDGRLGLEWTGPIERGVAAAPEPGAPPLVLVSLSTVWASGQEACYRRILAALGELPVRAIVTTGGLVVDGLVPPSNVEVVGRAPHAELMPRASLLIGHGGHSTTFKALAHGLPVLLLPQNGISDQPLVAATIERAGAGLALPQRASAERIRDAVERLLAERSIRRAAATLGQRLRSGDGVGAAADAIERAAASRVSRAAA